MIHDHNPHNNITPELMIKARNAWGFSVEQFGRILGMKLDKIERLEAGKEVPPFCYTLLCHAMLNPDAVKYSLIDLTQLAIKHSFLYSAWAYYDCVFKGMDPGHDSHARVVRYLDKLHEAGSTPFGSFPDPD